MNGLSLRDIARRSAIVFVVVILLPILLAIPLAPGCTARYDSRPEGTCDEVVCRPRSDWLMTERCTCYAPSRAEVRPDGLVVCRCPNAKDTAR